MKHQAQDSRRRMRLAAMVAWVAIGAGGCQAGGGTGAPEDGGSTAGHKVVLDWSGHARSALAAETGNQDPLVGTRTLAMVHLAMHDAVNAVDRRYQPCAYTAMNARADAVAAAASAAHGVLAGSNRSADQTAYARFWYEDSDIGWNSITRDVVVRRNQPLHDAARLFGLVHIALADAYIAGWDSKFHHDFWRPITAIRAAAGDGNDATLADPAWVPLLDTPPVQDHPSTHAVAGAAAASVLARVLGDANDFSLVSSTADNPGQARTFRRFSAASEENADSRIKAGIHFRFAVTEGLEMGHRVGQQAHDSPLRRAP